VKSLTELATQKPIGEFEGYKLRPFDGHHVWIENPEGEGMTITKMEVMGFLVKFFRERH